MRSKAGISQLYLLIRLGLKFWINANSLKPETVSGVKVWGYGWDWVKARVTVRVKYYG